MRRLLKADVRDSIERRRVMDIGTGNSLILLVVLVIISVVSPITAGILALLFGSVIVFGK